MASRACRITKPSKTNFIGGEIFRRFEVRDFKQVRFATMYFEGSVIAW